MGEVVSFRPTRQELEIIEQTRRQLGLSTRAEALRFLLLRGARAPGNEGLRRFLALRLPELESAPVTSRDIDDVLYGDR